MNKTPSAIPAVSATVAASALLPFGASAAESAAERVARIKSNDDSVRGPAWQTAERAGAPAVKALADLMTNPDFETARAAKRALYRIVRHAGRPGAHREAKAVVEELLPLLKTAPARVKCEVLWMLSEIAEDDAIPSMAVLLAEPETREDARCALMRFESAKATAAFQAAFATAPEPFKFALAESLRDRGVKVDGYPSQKLVPKRKTTLGEPAGK